MLGALSANRIHAQIRRISVAQAAAVGRARRMGASLTHVDGRRLAISVDRPSVYGLRSTVYGLRRFIPWTVDRGPWTVDRQTVPRWFWPSFRTFVNGGRWAVDGKR
jgi:hypothetical protein